ncbi:MAG: DUF5615 family PIN-like protein [Bacteroidetes bacterium]|nr:DUF5615 family PIN-like protein [Bacteroidota bacterium]
MLLADENIHGGIIRSLRQIHIDLLSIKETNPGLQDENIIELAKNTDRIILTEDKDFGEWVFAHKTKSISIILLRYHFSESEQDKNHI